MMKNKDLEREYKYFESIKDTLLKEKAGQFALVKDEKLVDTFHNEKDAYDEGVKKFGTSLFLIQKIEKDEQPESIQFLLLHV
jgi:hypothetical protein